jgi:hypothetical protein
LFHCAALPTVCHNLDVTSFYYTYALLDYPVLTFTVFHLTEWNSSLSFTARAVATQTMPIPVSRLCLLTNHNSAVSRLCLLTNHNSGVSRLCLLTNHKSQFRCLAASLAHKSQITIPVSCGFACTQITNHNSGTVRTGPDTMRFWKLCEEEPKFRRRWERTSCDVTAIYSVRKYGGNWA